MYNVYMVLDVGIYRGKKKLGKVDDLSDTFPLR